MSRTKLLQCPHCKSRYSSSLPCCPKCKEKDGVPFYTRRTGFCNCEQCRALRKAEKRGKLKRLT